MKATDSRAFDLRVTCAELAQWPETARCERYELLRTHRYRRRWR